MPIVGDARRALAALAEAYAPSPPTPPGSPPGGSGSARWRADRAPRNDAEAALDALQAAIGGDAIVTTDVGQHQMWAANRLRFDRPRRWITSGGLGTMGFGLPAAIGAQIACPQDTVVCVTGEGSLLLNVQELATAAHERLPVKIVVLDNGSLGMVRQQQDMFWGGRRSAVDLGATPDWPALAAAFGIAARDVSAADDDGSRTRWPPRSPSPGRRSCASRSIRRRLPADVQARRCRAGDDRNVTSPKAPAHRVRGSDREIVARTRVPGRRNPNCRVP